MKVRFAQYSFRFAKLILSDLLPQPDHIETALSEALRPFAAPTRPQFTSAVNEAFVVRGWKKRVGIPGLPRGSGFTVGLLRDRVAIELGSTHQSFLGGDLMKLQLASQPRANLIDSAVYITITKGFQDAMKKADVNWKGSVPFERVTRMLPQLREALGLPIQVIGVDA